MYLPTYWERGFTPRDKHIYIYIYLLCGPPGGVSLHDEDLALLRLSARAIGQLPRQQRGAEHRLAPHQLTRRFGRIRRFLSRNRLVQNSAEKGKMCVWGLTRIARRHHRKNHRNKETQPYHAPLSPHPPLSEPKSPCPKWRWKKGRFEYVIRVARRFHRNMETQPYHYL